MMWASRISNIGFQMAVPPLVGWWADEKWGFAPWLTILGACFGFAGGMYSILKLSEHFSRNDRKKRGTESSSPTSSKPSGDAKTD